MSKPFMKVTSDFTDDFNNIVSKFKKDVVLVGIPEDDSTRDAVDGKSPQINNATILALNNFGSPLQNIPAWPVMEMGIEQAQEDIAEQFKSAVKNSFNKGLSALDIYYNRLGIIASNSIKKVINSQEDAPDLAESTLASRKREGFRGTKRLIVTAQTRNAITYVINPGGLK